MRNPRTTPNKVVSLTRVYDNREYTYTMIVEVNGNPVVISFKNSLPDSGLNNLFNQLYPQSPIK